MNCKGPNWARRIALVAFLATAFAAVPTSAKNPPGHVYLSPASLGMVQFAVSHVGQQVETGDCGEFVRAAQKHVQSSIPQTRPSKLVYEQTYTNGKWVRHGSTQNILPGDTYGRGRIENGKHVSCHYGIVLTFGVCGSVVTAESNVGGNKHVALYVLDLTTLDKDAERNSIYFDRLPSP